MDNLWKIIGLLYFHHLVTLSACVEVYQEREREGDRGRWVSVLGERKNVLESVRVYVWVGDWREKERKRKKDT